MPHPSQVAPSQAEGHINDIQVYRKNRRCRKCRCLLSIYNPDHWCNVHMDYGHEKENRLSEEKRLRNANKCSKRHNKKKKLAREAKLALKPPETALESTKGE